MARGIQKESGNKKEVCKTCGTCPTCGHNPKTIQFIPYSIYVIPYVVPIYPYTNPWIPQYPYYNQFTISTGIDTQPNIGESVTNASYSMN